MKKDNAVRILLGEIWRTDSKAFTRIIVWNIVASLLGGVGIVMLIPLLNMLQIGQGGNMPAFVVAMPYTAQIAAVLAAYILLVTVRALLTRRISIRESDFIEQTSLKMRSRLYDAVTSTTWEKLSHYKSTDIINLFTNQCVQVTYGIRELIYLFSSIVSALIQLVIALLMNVPVTLIVCLLGGLMLTVFKSMRKKSRAYGDEMIKINRAFYEELQNQLSSIKEVRAYGVEKEHAGLFESISTSFRTAHMRYIKLVSMPSVVYSIAAALLIAGVYLICTLLLEVQTDRLVVLVYVFARLWPVFSGFQSRIQQINSCIPAYQKVCEVWDGAQKDAEISVEESDEDFSAWQDIRFDNVSFAYRDAEEVVLKDVDISFKRGEVTALLGRNGAGKTTAVNLLLGFLIPTAGSIYVNDRKLTSQNIRAWRAQVGYVPQDPLVLNTSVRENLHRFHPNATEQQIIDALKAAMAWDFVSKMPEGLDTQLGDRGIRLSGGERQRIVLARVLLGKPSLIVLDEATSALDWESENAFRNVIASMSGNVAVVLIAHRLATIRMASHAIVLEDGTVAEQGTLRELMSKPHGYIASMVNFE